MHIHIFHIVIQFPCIYSLRIASFYLFYTNRERISFNLINQNQTLIQAHKKCLWNLRQSNDEKYHIHGNLDFNAKSCINKCAYSFYKYSIFIQVLRLAHKCRNYQKYRIESQGYQQRIHASFYAIYSASVTSLVRAIDRHQTKLKVKSKRKYRQHVKYNSSIHIRV